MLNFGLSLAAKVGGNQGKEEKWEKKSEVKFENP